MSELCPLLPTATRFQRAAPPEILEAGRRQFGVTHHVLDVLVTEAGLQRPRIVSVICELKPASVPEHTRMGLEAKRTACPRRLLFNLLKAAIGLGLHGNLRALRARQRIGRGPLKAPQPRSLSKSPSYVWGFSFSEVQSQRKLKCLVWEFDPRSDSVPRSVRPLGNAVWLFNQ